MMKSNHFVLAAGVLLATSTCVMASAAYAHDEDAHESSRAARHEHESANSEARHAGQSSHDGDNTDMAPGTSRPVTLSNRGTRPVEIDIRFLGKNPGDFTQTNNCGERLKGQGSCVINVQFVPRAPGAKSATMEIRTSGGTQDVQLTGTGV